MLTTFCEDFWEGEGFDLCILRLRNSKECMKQISEYLRERAAIEETYAKSLTRLSKMNGFKDEVGTMKAAYEGIKDHLNTLAENRTAFGTDLRKLSDQIMKYKDAQKKMRKNNDAERDKYTKDLEKVRQEGEKLRQKYVQASQTADQDYAVYDRNSKNSLTARKDLDNSRAKWDKAEKEASANEKKFRGHLDNIHTAQDVWEKNMYKIFVDISCVQGQTIDYCKEMLIRYVDIENGHFHVEQEYVTKLRTVMDGIDKTFDMEEWTRINRTGSNRPAKDRIVPYISQYPQKYIDNPTLENPAAAYSGVTDMPTTPNSSAYARTMSVSGMRPTSVNDTTSAARTPKRQNDESSDEEDPSFSEPTTTAAPVEEPVVAPPEPEPVPAKAAKPLSVGKPPSKPTKLPPSTPKADYYVTSQYQYIAQYEGELSIDEGTRILVIDKNADGWWRGSVDGVEGLFPANYTDADLS